MLIQNSVLFQWHPRSLRNSKKFNLIWGGGEERENHETIYTTIPTLLRWIVACLWAAAAVLTLTGSPITSLCIRLHDVTWRHHPPTQQEQPRPRGQACKTVLYRLQKDSLRASLHVVLTTRQLWLFEREGVTLSAISRTALHIYSSSTCRWFVGTMAGRLLTLRRQLETRRRFQTFVGCVPILMSAGNGPSIPDVPWARTDSQTRWKRTVNSRCSLGAYWLIWQLETQRQIFVGRVINSVYQL